MSDLTEETAQNLMGALQRVLDVLPVHVNAPPASLQQQSSAATTGLPLPRRPAARPVTALLSRPTAVSATADGTSRPNTRPIPTRRPLALQEHARLFGYTPSAPQPAKKKKCKVFQRNVVCLPGRDAEVVPSKDERTLLKANGIGEACAEFELDGNADHVENQILNLFSKEELTMGFEIMVPRTKSRSILEVVHTGPCPAKELKLISSQRFYIRPIQQDIQLTEFSPPSSTSTLKCYHCGMFFATSLLRAHIDECTLSAQDQQHSSSAPDDKEDITPPAIGCYDSQEIIQILGLLKEAFNDDSNPSEIVSAFRQVYLQGRSLNCAEGDETFVEGDTYDIMISRQDIFGGMLDELSADVYKPRLPLKVEFMGERGSDLGGPRREFLRLALNEVYQKVTIGPATSRSLVAEQATTYLHRKVFYVAGMVMGQCIMQDGPRPDFLAAALVDRLVECPQDPCEVQLANGLQQTGVINMIKAFSQCKCLLHTSDQRPKATAAMVIGSFEPKFSEQGSNSRMHEETMMTHFIRYLREVEAGQHHCNSLEDESVVTLHHIFQFVTGLEHMPVCGWHPPLTVTFIPQDVALMGIGACTCSHQLQLPVPASSHDPMPPRSVIFDLFNKSFPDEFFGKA